MKSKEDIYKSMLKRNYSILSKAKSECIVRFKRYVINMRSTENNFFSDEDRFALSSEEVNRKKRKYELENRNLKVFYGSLRDTQK